jgi:hypothetical protein
MRRLLIFAAAPVLLLAIAAIILAMVGGHSPDPDYAYFFNGLEILDLHPPSYYDHPGTPVEMLAALAILVTWLLRLPVDGASILASAVARPELYLNVINAALVSAAAGALLWFGQRCWRATASRTVALAGQCSIFLSFPALTALNRVTSEPLLVAASFALAAFAAPILLGQAPGDRRAARILGALLGFAIATKYTALPLLAAILFLPGRAQWKQAALFAAGSFILFTLPTAHHYPQMGFALFRFATRQGAYGSGAVGVPGGGALLEHGMALLRQAPEVFVFAAVYWAAFALGPVRAKRLFGVSALILTLQILMCLKASEARYLTPVVGVMALANAGLVFYAGTRQLRALMAALLAAAIASNGLSVSAWARDMRAVDDNDQMLLRQMRAQGCALVPFYMVKLHTYNLDFGNQFTNNHFGAALRSQLPHAVSYDIARKEFSAFGEPVAVNQVKARLAHPGCVRLVGWPVERHGATIGLAPQSLTPVGRSSHAGYEIVVYAYRPLE